MIIVDFNTRIYSPIFCGCNIPNVAKNVDFTDSTPPLTNTIERDNLWSV